MQKLPLRTCLMTCALRRRFLDSKHFQKKMAKNVCMDHDVIAGGRGLQDVAKDLAGGLGMEGAFSALGNVENLAPEPEEDDDDEEDGVSGDDQEQAESESGDDEDANPKKKGGKRRWFDRDREVNKAYKAVKMTYDKLWSAANSERAKIETTKKELEGLGAKEKKQVEGDRIIMVSRETCLNLLFGAPNPLKQYIASFDEGLESTRSSVDSRAALGRAAPSRTFRQLRTFNEWLSEIEQILECQSVKDLEQAKVTLNNHFKGPISDLVSAAKGSLNDVQRALKALKKAAEQAAAAKPSTSKPGKKRLESRAHGPAVFQAVEAMSKVPEIKEGEELPDFDYPALIHTEPAKLAKFEAHPAVKTTIMQEFVEVFVAQAPAQKVDRAHKRYPATSDVYQIMSARMASLLRQAGPCASPELPQDLKASLDCQVVVVQKNAIKFATEKNLAGRVPDSPKPPSYAC